MFQIARLSADVVISSPPLGHVHTDVDITLNELPPTIAPFAFERWPWWRWLAGIG